MATGLKHIRARLQSEVDLIIEVRDARIPKASANTDLILKGKGEGIEVITVYNKSDLIEKNKLKVMIKDIPTSSMLYCKDERKDLRKLYQLVQSESLPNNSSKLSKKRVMVVGIPNVGKSTIINGLRMIGTGFGGKAVKAGNLAGVTKSLSELVCISRDPLIYLIDTPGILPPKITNVQDGLKVALCGGFYDKTVGMSLLAEFLLHNLNTRKDSQAYKTLFHFYKLKSEKDAEDLKLFLPLAAKRIGALLPGGEVDLERAAGFLVRQFRSGKLGPFSLE